MQNPSKMEQPNLKSPIKKSKKGNLPYLKFRKKLRKSFWG